MRLSQLLLVAGAAATPASALPRGAETVSKTVEGRAAGITDAEMDTFKYFGQYQAAAFCNSNASAGAEIVCSNDVCPDVTANKVKVLTSLDPGTSTNVSGFVAQDDVKKLIVVAFRGSVTVRNWIADILFAFTSCEYTSDCKVHVGFDLAWRQAKDQILPAVEAAKKATGYRVVVTGHSLGAAVATLAGTAIRASGIDPTADIYTMGSPRVGNAAFATFVMNQSGAEYRITKEDDIVPRLPPLFLGYSHTTPEYYMQGHNSTFTGYTAADVKVCQGTMGCLNSELGFATDAHIHYTEVMNACTPGKSPAERRDKISDADLESRLKLWAEMDREYLAILPADEVAA